MKNLLFITNIAGSKMKVDFCKGAINAAKKCNLKFLSVANRSASTLEQMKIDEQEYGVFLKHADISRSPFSKSNIIAYKQIVKLINDENIDYIHCNTPVGGLIGRLAGKKCKVKKVIYQAHGFHFYKGASKKNWLIYYLIEKWLAHYTDAIITINKEDYEAAQKFKLKKGGKAYLVHGVGIDLKDYKNPAPTNQAKRDELGIPADAFVLISVGELNENKNNKVIISALSKLNRKDIHYVLCGIGDKEQALKEQAEAAGLSNNIHFLGFRKDVKQLYEMADCFVMSSYREGLPRSIMEGMASGLPCIVSDIRGNVDLVEDNVGGYLCKSDDHSGFANAISKLAKNTEVREKMGAYNLEKIKEFDVSVVEKELLDIYEEVLK